MNIIKIPTATLFLLVAIVGIVSAAVIGLTLFAHIEGTGTYQQGGAVSRGFTLQDGDTADTVTFLPDETDANKYYLNFPLYANQQNVKYTKVLKIVPDGSMTGLIFSGIQRTNNGITSAYLTFSEEGSPTEPVSEITTIPTMVNFSVVGNHNYFVNLIVNTGNAGSSTESITFDISKYEQ
jgi:hypothetical protein